MSRDREPSAVRWVLWAVLAVVWLLLAMSRFRAGETGWGWVSVVLAVGWVALAVKEWRHRQYHLEGGARRR